MQIYEIDLSCRSIRVDLLWTSRKQICNGDLNGRLPGRSKRWICYEHLKRHAMQIGKVDLQ